MGGFIQPTRPAFPKGMKGFHPFQQWFLPRRVWSSLLLALLALLAFGVSAEYLGPDRTVTTWVWRRQQCHYQAVYDPPGSEWYGCTLNLYREPGASCPSTGSVIDYFDPAYCGWTESYCKTKGCSISLSSSTVSCSEGQEYCRSVRSSSTYPPATVAGSLNCTQPGSNGWCLGPAALAINANEPLSGYSILAIEGSQNGETFACEGSSCSLPLIEGLNAFEYWALSSWGDTSLKGSSTGRLDTRSPGLDGSLDGRPGADGWFVSDVSLSASATDPEPGSGLAGLTYSLNGSSSAPFPGTLTLADGLHAVTLTARDLAGNANSLSQTVRVDSQPPLVSLDAAESFCPGCGDRLSIQSRASDGLSGVASWGLFADGALLAGGSGEADESLEWDGRPLGAGSHSLSLQAYDAAGNFAAADLPLRIQSAPSEAETDDWSGPLLPDSGPLLPIEATPAAGGDEASSTRPLALSGDEAPAAAVVPLLPAPVVGGAAVQTLSSPPSDPLESLGLSSENLLWGAAAMAALGAANAVLLDEKRKRKQEEARAAAEAARKNQDAAARDQGYDSHAAMVEHQLLVAKDAAFYAELAAWKARQAAGEEEKFQPSSMPANLPIEAQMAFRHGGAAAQEWVTNNAEKLIAAHQAQLAAEKARKALEALGQPDQTQAEKLAAYKATEKYQESQAKLAEWEQQKAAEEEKKSVGEKVLDWIDNHQVAASIGIGLAVGLGAAAIILTGGLATPLVLGGAALVAGALTAGGTMALNAHYDRPLGDNIWRNVAFSAGTAIVTTALTVFVLGGGLQSTLLTIGNGTAAYCASHPQICARVEPALKALDFLEEAWLMAKGTVQTWLGDSAGAAETMLELQLERMDGGLPGNTAARAVGQELSELIGKYGDDAADLVRKYGDDALRLIQKYGDEGIAILNRYGDDGIKLLQKYGDDVILALDGKVIKVVSGNADEFARDLAQATGARVWVSSTGAVYASQSTDEAIEAARKLSSSISGNHDELVDAIARGSTRGSGDRVVLGRFGANGEYIQDALDNSGIFYDTGNEVWDLISGNDSPIKPFAVNAKFLQNQLESGISRIDFVSGNITDILEKYPTSYSSQEIRWMMEHANDYGYELVGNSWIKRSP